MCGCCKVDVRVGLRLCGFVWGRHKVMHKVVSVKWKCKKQRESTHGAKVVASSSADWLVRSMVLVEGRETTNSMVGRREVSSKKGSRKGAGAGTGGVCTWHSCGSCIPGAAGVQAWRQLQQLSSLSSGGKIPMASWSRVASGRTCAGGTRGLHHRLRCPLQCRRRRHQPTGCGV